jgi:hypothetical protein
MRFVFSSALKDLRRIRRDPVTLLTWLGIPLFIAVILVVIFGRGDARPNGKLLMVDEDAGHRRYAAGRRLQPGAARPI